MQILSVVQLQYGVFLYEIRKIHPVLVGANPFLFFIFIYFFAIILCFCLHYLSLHLFLIFYLLTATSSPALQTLSSVPLDLS